MMSSLSVSKVRLAFECPRLLYLGHHFGGMTMFLPPEKALGIGSAFHQLSDAFVKQLRSDAQCQALLAAEPEALDVAKIAQAFQQRLYQAIFFPFLQQAIAEKPDKAQALHQGWAFKV